MAHATLAPQSLEESDEKHDHNNNNQVFDTNPGSTKNLALTSNISPPSAPDWLTTQDIINASLRKSRCQKYLSYQTS